MAARQAPVAIAKMQNDSKNTMIFIVCAMALMLVYQLFVLQPAAQRRQAEARARAAVVQQTPQGSVAAPQAVVTVSRDDAMRASPRLQIDTPSLKGSIALKGGRIDDLFLKTYHATLEPNSPLVELFRPPGAADAYFTTFGWVGTNLAGLPDDSTPWTLASGSVLSPGHPVALIYRSPQGLVFTRGIAVDDKYMFTLTDMVANRSGAAVTLAPYASVERQGLPADIFTAVNVHQGALGWLGDPKADLKLSAYKTWKKKGEIDTPSIGGWLGITDKYWMAALIPDQRDKVKATFRVTPLSGVDVYDTSFLGASRSLAAGQQLSTTSRLFAGAKTVPLLKAYSTGLGIPEFDRAVDWGQLWFLTRPAFSVLEFFYHHVGNFGVAILLLTVCVRLLLFWPANKSYESATKMKKVQPQLEKIKAQHKDDPAKYQQEMMALYQREKINPFLGCLPMLAVIPVFLALFKLLSVTIEMRQAPFFGFVRDLSAPDTSTIWNLFGLIPFDPAHLPMVGAILAGPLHLGVWALAYGFTTWLSQSMTPTQGMDPTQQKMMQFMPLLFMFIMARFTVGLLIYYSWSNLLTLTQQYVIMRRFKVDNPIDSLIGKLTDRGKPVV